MAIGQIMAGIGISALGGIFGGGDSADDYAKKIQDQYNKMRADQKDIYQDALRGINSQFGAVLNRFNQNLSAYKDELEKQYPQRKKEIQEIFSEQNPAVKSYMDNLRKGYEDTQKRVYGQIKRANMDETRQWKQAGITGGTIGRMIAGNQMARLEQGEQMLTERFNQVLAPQSQIAQAQMGALAGAEQQQAGAKQQAGMLGVQMPAQIGMAQGQAQAGLGQAYMGNVAGLGQTAMSGQAGIYGKGMDQGQGGLGSILGQAGSGLIAGGLENIFAKETQQ